MAKTVYFASVRAAYDASQTGDAEKGDILIVADERAVGVADTYPLGVTVEGKGFHWVDDHAVVTYLAQWGLTDAVKAAMAVARERGYNLARWTEFVI